jgi:ketosteroid isomerase-like protein
MNRQNNRMNYQDLIEQAYRAFNARNIDGVLELMQPDVQWPNGWEGGYVNGHDEVRAYWLRQWQELDPIVIPVSVQEKPDGHPDGHIEVVVHQVVKDRSGQVVADGQIKHLYAFDEGKIIRMDIENLPASPATIDN